MDAIRGFLSLLARLMIVAIFLTSAVLDKIPNFAAVAEKMAAKGVPQPGILLVGAIAFLLLGSVSLVLGYKARLGSLLLLVFLVAATYYFHAFWKLPEAERMPEQIAFMKNLALMGTMVFLIANGPGPWSVDAARSAPADTDRDADDEDA